MESKLIIIRGNSGSGKTTIAKSLQKHFGRGTLLVSQDQVRRDMLQVHDREGNLSIGLICQLAKYGKGKSKVVIVEGILNKKLYGEMLKDLIHFFNEKAYIYYFDLPFEETVVRHQSRPQRSEFDEDAMRSWWLANDELGVEGEIKLTADMSQNDVLNRMIKQIETV